ncbi:hypothetical protein [Deinococcus multiflagellatus]|uniref:Lipoprotein n=1 Tax=Deinococcus multiflagellatus TaxID=1656887 RepID=A0ABW1ZK06_9DEIO|nr:hypothetical protein [Deinococcus multiflagellatus]MBZ9712539.1 hypothetical protein [Deinococcus multiflagellatus]
MNWWVEGRSGFRASLLIIGLSSCSSAPNQAAQQLQVQAQAFLGTQNPCLHTSEVTDEDHYYVGWDQVASKQVNVSAQETLPIHIENVEELISRDNAQVVRKLISPNAVAEIETINPVSYIRLSFKGEGKERKMIKQTCLMEDLNG